MAQVRSVTAAASRAACGQCRRFAKAEHGTVAMFAMVLFTLMIMMGGMAVDLMRYEQTRTTLQNTLDRSTLAAASLSQDLDAIDVVNDYFDKAGLLQYLTNVQVDEGINFKEVTADARADAEPYFLHMLGVQDFEAPGHSMAEQRVTNVEIALVLDVSGSMSGTKLSNLKTAAKDLVDLVVQDVQDPYYSKASLVPYSAAVNAGAYANDVRGALRQPTPISTMTMATQAEVTTTLDHNLIEGEKVYIASLKKDLDFFKARA